jgi:hypothetical protein
MKSLDRTYRSKTIKKTKRVSESEELGREREIN